MIASVKAALAAGILAAAAPTAPTLSALLGLTAPGGSQGRVLAEALR